MSNKHCAALNLLKNTFRNIQNGSATAADPCKTQGYSSVGLVAQRSLRIAKNIQARVLCVDTSIGQTMKHDDASMPILKISHGQDLESKCSNCFFLHRIRATLLK